MDLLQAVLNAQGGGAVNELAKNFGLSTGQAQSAIEHLLPGLASGVAKNTATPQGLEGLLGALAGGGHGSYLDDLSRLGAQDTVRDGNGILGHVLGSKDASRDLATRASAQTGISPEILKRMLPVIATMVMGALAKQTASRTSAPGAAPAGGGGLAGMLGSFLDRDKDGSVADDIAGMLGKFLK